LLIDTCTGERVAYCLHTHTHARVQVKVEIVDVNDNAPVFPERRISHDISELAEPGTSLAVPAATDLDSGRNAIYRYDVVPRDGKFELTSRATADGSTDLRLVLRDRLDRELEDRYLVTVLAVDGGDPPKTGSVEINITVVDANDNNPQFDNSSYEVFSRIVSLSFSHSLPLSLLSSIISTPSIETNV